MLECFEKNEINVIRHFVPYFVPHVKYSLTEEGGPNIDRRMFLNNLYFVPSGFA